MPGKSRHGKGKYATQSKKKSRAKRPSLSAQQPKVAQASQSASSPVVSAPSASVTAPAAKPALVRHLYIKPELRTIGILAGIMLIVLIVLALVLS